MLHLFQNFVPFSPLTPIRAVETVDTVLLISVNAPVKKECMRNDMLVQRDLG